MYFSKALKSHQNLQSYKIKISFFDKLFICNYIYFPTNVSFYKYPTMKSTTLTNDSAQYVLWHFFSYSIRSVKHNERAVI